METLLLHHGDRKLTSADKKRELVEFQWKPKVPRDLNLALKKCVCYNGVKYKRNTLYNKVVENEQNVCLSGFG